MPPKPLVLAVLCAVLVVAAWLSFRPSATRPTSVQGARDDASHVRTADPLATARDTANSPPAQQSSALPATVLSPGASGRTTADASLAASAASSATAAVNNQPPMHEAVVDEETVNAIDQIQLMLRDFRTIGGDNPVGTNAEIMKSIMGGNPKQATLGPPEGQSLNGEGELIDRWGTPYFFHQISGKEMQVRSAGPDRKMWTDDDIQP